MAVRADVDEMIAYLNELLSMDRHFMQELVDQRIPCNTAILNHPTAQVYIGNADDTYVRPGESRCGLIGLLNGYFGVFDEGQFEGWGPISATYDNGKLIRFERTGSST